MLYFIYGSDLTLSHKKLADLISLELSKQPQIEIFDLDNESFSHDQLEELLVSRGLFVSHYIIKARHLWSDKKQVEELLLRLQTIIDSPHVFIFQEETVLPEVLKKIKTKTKNVYFYDLKLETSKMTNWLFSVTDALGVKSRKDLWVAISIARFKNLEAEIVFWTLIKALQNIQLVLSGEDLTSLKWHPFVLSKTKNQARNFTQKEVLKLFDQLFVLYHESRRGGLSLYDRLEKFSLEI